MLACLCVVVLLVYAVFIVSYQSDEACRKWRMFWYRLKEAVMILTAFLFIVVLIIASIAMNLHLADLAREWFFR